jgi:hypothetical protein
MIPNNIRAIIARSLVCYKATLEVSVAPEKLGPGVINAILAAEVWLAAQPADEWRPVEDGRMNAAEWIATAIDLLNILVDAPLPSGLTDTINELLNDQPDYMALDVILAEHDQYIAPVNAAMAKTPPSGMGRKEA